MSGRKVLIAIGDAATSDFILPVLPYLTDVGIDFQIVVDPARKAVGGVTLNKNGVPFSTAEDVAVEVLRVKDLVICGTVVKARTLVRNVTSRALNIGKMVIWAADFYGGGCMEAMLDLTPDYLTVLDTVALGMVRRARPDYASDHIVPTGNPAWDRIPRLESERDDNRFKMDSILGLVPKQKFVVVFCSDTSQFAREDMEGMVRALAAYSDQRGTNFVFYLHFADQQKEEWRRKIRAASRNFFTPEALTGDLLADAIAADGVVVQYGQLGCQAAMAVPTLFVLLPSMRQYWTDNFGLGWSERFFPQIKFHAAEAAWDVREIAPALDRMLYPESGYRESFLDARQAYFSTLFDGGATRRFMELVNFCLSRK